MHLRVPYPADPPQTLQIWSYHAHVTCTGPLTHVSLTKRPHLPSMLHSWRRNLKARAVVTPLPRHAL